MTRTTIATLMQGDALAAVEDLDGACRRPQIDLLANEIVRHAIEEGLELNVVIRRQANQTSFGEFVVFTRKAGERGTFDTLKYLPSRHSSLVCDRVIVMKNGSLIFEGRPLDFVDRDKLMEMY